MHSDQINVGDFGMAMRVRDSLEAMQAVAACRNAPDLLPNDFLALRALMGRPMV